MAELEEELIGDDLDYEYDLDEEEEEALLAGEVPSHEVNVEDIIELGVEDDFGGEEDGGHISHSKGVHSRLQHPNRLQTSGRLQHANARYGDDEPPQNRLQASGRLQPPSTVYEEEIQPQNRLQASGRLQAADTVYEEEEIQDSYDASMNDEPVAVHIQDETQNVLEEEEEEDEDEDDGGGRDRFKSERSKISITNTPTKRVIPDSLDQVQVKEQLTQKVQGGRGRGRGGFMPRGGMRGGQRGGRGGQMGPPLGWQGGRGMPMPQPWPPKSQQQQPPPLMMNPPSRMNMARGQGGLPGMGRPNIYSLFGPGPPASQGQNQLLRNASPGNFSLMGNVPWSAGVGPFNAPGILSQLIPRPQIPPPEDMRNLIKKRGINDPMMGSPSKQMKMNQGPINNQHMPPNQNMTPNQHMSPQRGGMVRKPPVTSRLSMPAPSANPNLTTIQTAASNVNPNLTTIKTVDINAVQQKNFQNKPQQNQPEKTPQNVNQISQQMNKPPVNQFEQKPVQNNQTQQNHMSNEQDQPSKVQDLNSQSKSSPEKEQVPLTPEDVEYQKKLEQQKKLREEMLAKKEARRKAAANEMAKKKAEEEKKNVPPTSTVTAEANKPNQQQQQLAPTPQPQSVKKEVPGVNRVQQQQNVQQNQPSNIQSAAKPQIQPNLPQNQQRQVFRKMRMPNPPNQGGPRSHLNLSQPFRGGMNQHQIRGPPPSRYSDIPHPPQSNDPKYGQQPRPYYPPSQDMSPHHQGPPGQQQPLQPPHHPSSGTPQLPPHGPSHGLPPHGPPSLGPPHSHDHHAPPASDMHRLPPVSQLPRSSHSILSAPRPSAQAILGPPPELPHRPLIDHHDPYPSQSDLYSSRAPLPGRHPHEMERSYDYGNQQYSDSQRSSSWNEYSQSYDNYRDGYNERGDYYRRDSYPDQQGYQDTYRYDSYREYDDRYRDDYYRDSYSYDQYREGDYRYSQEPVSQSSRGMPAKQPGGSHMDMDRSSHNVQVQLIDTLPQKPIMPVVHGQVGQKIQTVQRQPVTNMRKTLYRRITRKNAKGEVISVKKIPVDEHGEQIGEPITEYLKTDIIEDPQTIPVVSHQQVQERVPVVKTVRQIVRKVPVPQVEAEVQQANQLRIMRQKKRQQQQQGQQPIKVVKRTVITPGDLVASPPKQGTRRIIHTTTSQPTTSESVTQPSTGIRRVVTASKSLTESDLPTVQLCDLPTNLTLGDVNQMVANAGVGQPMSVSYVPGSGECYVSFRSVEIAVKFYHKMNRRMVNMSFIKAKYVIPKV